MYNIGNYSWRYNYLDSLGCDYCNNYQYDEEDDAYYCECEMDEDDYGRIVSGMSKGCPYFVDGDEYKVVRHQM